MLPEFPDGELGRWACLGAVTDRSVRLWLREPGGGPADATLRVGAAVVRQRLAPAAEHDGVCAADLALDRPAPDAAFTIEVAGMARRGRFAPAEGERAAFTFAFGSCHLPFGVRDGALVPRAAAGMYPAMSRLLDTCDARFLLLIGDQIYSDALAPLDLRRRLKAGTLALTDAELLEHYRRLYRGYFNQPGFRELLAGRPVYFIWDDHDIFEAAGSYPGRDAVDRRLFAAAAAAYREYQHLHNPGAGLEDEPPYHYRFWFGDTGFFVLDLRGVRDYARGALLGERQWRDFEAFLAAAEARGVPTLFVVASVPAIHLSPAIVRLLEWLPSDRRSAARDRWSAIPFRKDRTRLLERLLDWQAARPERQVFLLSGDVHAGAAFRVRRSGRPGLVHQWTSSPLTTPRPRSDRLANRVGTRLASWGEDRYAVERRGLETRSNFGLVEVVPLADGGHQVVFTLEAYPDRGPDLRADVRVAARPETWGEGV